MTKPTKTRRRFTAQQRQEAVELCLSEGLSCTAVAQRLGLPNSSLAKWVRQARIDRGDFGSPEPVTARKGATPGLPFRRPASTVAAVAR
jgi:transposase-like protein